MVQERINSRLESKTIGIAMSKSNYDALEKKIIILKTIKENATTIWPSKKTNFFLFVDHFYGELYT